MIGALWHSGDKPLHSFELTVYGIGAQEIEEAVKWLALTSDEDGNLTAHRDVHGFTLTIHAEATADQARYLVDRLYAARDQRGREAVDVA
jgi:hypothetical protein